MENKMREPLYRGDNLMELLTARIAVFRGILGLVVFPLFLMLTNTREHAAS